MTSKKKHDDSEAGKPPAKPKSSGYRALVGVAPKEGDRIPAGEVIPAGAIPTKTLERMHAKNQVESDKE